MHPILRATVFSLPLLLAAPCIAVAAPLDASAETPETEDRAQGSEKKGSKKKGGKKKGGKKKGGKKKGSKKKGSKKKGSKQERVRSLCADLSCTEAQRERVAASVQALREQHRAARAGEQALHTSLSRELAKDKPSKKELQRIHNDLARMQSTMADATLDTLLDIHAVLDPTQRERLASMVEHDGLRRLFKPGHAGPGARKRGAATQSAPPPP